MVDLTGIDAILFDLGGVILNIDPQRTINALQKYSKAEQRERYDHHEQFAFLSLYEEGKMKCDEFRSAIREELKVFASDEEIDIAWCKLLLDIPKKRVELLYSLKNRFKIYLYSNTCEIHKNFFDQQMIQIHGVELDTLFHTAYYSHLLGVRKPKEEGFLKIIKEQNLNPRRTLFVDDKLDNIETAKRLGFKVFQADPNICITTVFKF